ncbi:MAG TPA: hydroxyacylglutathione hydrolase [Rhizomicrobium sp.]|jgi:hydroxyacylglutathione hydrolase|nr:hydroxyacylglutathione hydrolase [Rhizomicrobium sp.]
MSVEIEIVPCLSDNYAYLVKSGTDCAVVDPSEPEPVKAALAKRGWTPTHILNTHHHLDHTGGNLALKEEFGAQVVGPAKDAARIPGLDIGVDEASGWTFDGRPVRVLEVPAHTRGAITFVIDGNAFTGDTLFTLGCGRLFEGDPATMWASLSKLMTLPDDTLIWCGHEYTQSNGRFARSIEPGNAALEARMKDVDAARAAGKPTVPATLGLEKQTNPFLRPDSAEIRRSIGMEDADTVTAFGEIRERKNNF